MGYMQLTTIFLAIISITIFVVNNSAINRLEEELQKLKELVRKLHD